MDQEEIRFLGIDFEGDYVFAIPKTPVLYFDECGGTRDHAVLAFVNRGDFVSSAGDWYQPKIVKKPGKKNVDHQREVVRKWREERFIDDANTFTQ